MNKTKTRQLAIVLALLSILAGNETLVQAESRWKTYVKGPGATWVQGCAYEVSPRGFTVGNGSSTIDVTVTTGSGCSWSVSGYPTWVTPTVSGNVVHLAISTGVNSARSADVTIAGQKVRICQEGRNPRVATVSPAELIVEGRGGYAFQTIAVTGTSAGDVWASASSDAWITVLGRCSGNSSGLIIIMTEPNHTGITRVGSIEVGRKWVRIVQPPVVY